MGLLIQLGRIALAIVAGFVGGWLLFMPLHIRLLPPGLFVPFCMVAVWFLLPRLFPAFRSTSVAEGPVTLQVNGQTFQATHCTKNLAINATTGQVWFRDTKGKEWLLDRADIRTWDHQWVDQPNKYGHIWHNSNHLVITTRSVDHPTHKISMGHWNKHELAKEWHARLTAMLNM